MSAQEVQNKNGKIASYLITTQEKIVKMQVLASNDNIGYLSYTKIKSPE